MRRLVWVLALMTALVAGGGLFVSNSPVGQVYIPAGTGTTAKQICSLTHISGFSPERARALYVSPVLGAADGLVQVQIDDQNARVTSSLLGVLFKQTAVYREGMGCTLVHGSGEFDPDASLPAMSPRPMALDTAHRDTHFDRDALDAALVEAFTEDGRNTLGVVILHQGRLITERYADGVDETTLLHGWSMTKSQAATLAGVLTQRGLIDVTETGQVPELAAAGRPEITVDHLLRMTGGLAGYETHTGFDPVSDMLFTESDMARFAANAEQIAPPGTRFDYQSGNTILAGSALEEYLGDTPQAKMATIRDWLFEPLGMAHTVIESDESGTLQWSSYMYATARDWARLGQLYLDGGRAPDGAQIIPETWIDYVTTPTPGSNGEYGSGFWMYYAGQPEFTFVMNGFQGQLTYIVPSEDLVVVRLGATNGQHEGTPELARAVIAAKTIPVEYSENQDRGD
jgi:CubicO group peptidase (beta-lactamase class C family)